MVFCWIFESNCLGTGGLAQFFYLIGRVFALSLCSGGGKFALSKNSRRFAPGGWLGLELTDTYSGINPHVVVGLLLIIRAQFAILVTG